MRDFSDFAEPIFNEMDLDWWMYKEEQRVHNLARDIIIRRLKGLYSYQVYGYSYSFTAHHCEYEGKVFKADVYSKRLDTKGLRH